MPRPTKCLPVYLDRDTYEAFEQLALRYDRDALQQARHLIRRAVASAYRRGLIVRPAVQGQPEEGQRREQEDGER